MGCLEGDCGPDDPAAPSHTVMLTSFYLQETEATSAEMAHFRREQPSDRAGPPSVRRGRRAGPTPRHARLPRRGRVHRRSICRRPPAERGPVGVRRQVEVGQGRARLLGSWRPADGGSARLNAPPPRLPPRQPQPHRRDGTLARRRGPIPGDRASPSRASFSTWPATSANGAGMFMPPMKRTPPASPRRPPPSIVRRPTPPPRRSRSAAARSPRPPSRTSAPPAAPSAAGTDSLSDVGFRVDAWRPWIPAGVRRQVIHRDAVFSRVRRWRLGRRRCAAPVCGFTTLFAFANPDLPTP